MVVVYFNTRVNIYNGTLSYMSTDGTIGPERNAVIGRNDSLKVFDSV